MFSILKFKNQFISFSISLIMYFNFISISGFSIHTHLDWQTHVKPNNAYILHINFINSMALHGDNIKFERDQKNVFICPLSFAVNIILSQFAPYITYICIIYVFICINVIHIFQITRKKMLGNLNRRHECEKEKETLM